MRETRLSGSEGGGAVAGSPYPYFSFAPSGLMALKFPAVAKYKGLIERCARDLEAAQRSI